MGAATLLAFAPGLALGSVLNRVASQLPERRLAWRVRSMCPHCGHVASLLESVALFSYLMRGGKCARCGARRSLRYPFLEVATGFLFVASFTRYGFTGRAFVASAACAVVLVLAVIDVERRVLPNAIVIPAGVLILVANIIVAPDRALEWIVASFATGMTMLAVALASRGAVGMGDVKLAFLLGAVLGRDVLPAFIVGLLAAFIAAVFLVGTRGLDARKESMPLAPFLALGAVVTLLLL